MIREYWNFTAGEEQLICGGTGLFIVLTVLGVALRPRMAKSGPAAAAPGPDSTATASAADAAVQSAPQDPRADVSFKHRFLAVSREGQRLMSHLRRAMRHSMDPREWIAHSPFLSLAGGTAAGWFAGRSLLRPTPADTAGAGATARTARAERTVPGSSILWRDLVMPAISQLIVGMTASKPTDPPPPSDRAEEPLRRDVVQPQRPGDLKPEHSGDPTFH